jgi:D-glycero-D-manno-heptose 1,7-bisphosphate phosphatase
MKKKVVFLDRDGVLNKERGEYTYKTKDFEWVPDAIEALKLLYNNGFELIIISNQGGVSKNIYTKTNIFNIENAIKQPLEKQGVKILDSFYCPHHDAIEKCLCRKPKSLMLEKAIAKHNINPKQSYFVGDSERDVIAGQNVDVKGILMQPNVSLLLAIKDIINE